ncbi:MAG: SagB/ThcOx family dehydrogenase [Proteobacteria bacterium]|nr:SagB/ThcOx family dehydrogenase [Pseudomonadota bacterium]MBU1743111.1 SagB/ThcOx family dehydrogenase [Pseudomonadota bacterium]
MLKKMGLLTWGLGLTLAASPINATPPSDVVDLPQQTYTGRMTVAYALKVRRTIRSFKATPLSLKQLAQILWAGYGITAGPIFKTVPSAGATYPLDLYAVVGQNGVKDLPAGVYHYRPGKHDLKRVKAGDLRADVAGAAWFQKWMAQAPVMIVITGEYGRTTWKYAARGRVYVHVEAGCVAQSIFLMVQDMGLAAGIVGAMRVNTIRDRLGLPDKHQPLLVMPLGHRK